jgi:flagellar motor switch protein FliN
MDTSPSANVNLDLIMDVELPISVRFGQTTMLLEDILKLGHGSVIELDKLAEEPVDLLVNGRLLARGEVVVADGHYAIRITQVESPAERIRSLGA